MKNKIRQYIYSAIFIFILLAGFFLNFFVEIILLFFYGLFWIYKTYKEPILKGREEIKNEKNIIKKFLILSFRTFEFFILVFCPVVLLPALKSFLNWFEKKLKIQNN